MVELHPLSEYPDQFWSTYQDDEQYKVKKVDRKSMLYSGSRKCVRFVCVSDTHCRAMRGDIIPDGDVLLHAGDFSMKGRVSEIEQFNKFLGMLPHKHKVVIAGNHDLSFDKTIMDSEYEHKIFYGKLKAAFLAEMQEMGQTDAKDLLTNCIYLEDSSVVLHGIKIYGSPWQPKFMDWGFNLPRGQPCLEKWNMIPEDTDILITHGPPIGHGDYCLSGNRAGCVDLLHTIQRRVKPRYHVFGHIHEGYGITRNSNTFFINASTCTLRYKASNPAIVFDYVLGDDGKTSSL